MMEQQDDIIMGGLRPPGMGSSPVNDFWGILDEWKVVSGFGGQPMIAFDYSDCEIIDADVPWNFPIVHIEIKKSDVGYIEPKQVGETTVGGGSGWGYFTNSFLALGLISLNQLVGKRQHIVRDKGITYFAGGTLGMGYRILEVEGIEAPIEPLEAAKRLLNGYTEAEFYQAVVEDRVIKLDEQLMESIMGKTFIPSVLDEFTLGEDGIYVRKK